MDINLLKPYKALLTNNTRYYLLYGGRAGGRSYAGSQKALLDTITRPYSRVAIMRYIAGDIRHSIWLDIKDRIEEYGLPKPKSDHSMVYNYKGNTIDAKGFKQSTGQNKAKLKSLAGYTTVIIEEADEITEEDFDHLDTSIRTKKAKNNIVLMFNMPDKNHWIIRRWFNLEDSEFEGYFIATPKDRPDTTYIEASYKDNIVNLSKEAVDTMEGFKHRRPEYYYNMIRGLVPSGKKGRVYLHWKPITNKEFNELPYHSDYGLDFGFTNDPTALVEIKRHNNKLYLKELIYEVGLLNSHIADRMKSLGVKGIIVADSAEPKSIEEIRLHGFNIIGADKGKDSVEYGIGALQEMDVYYTEDSLNLANEVQNYVYKLDKNKEPTNSPMDEYNHLMDAIRYGTVIKKKDFVIL
jgi:phage terminase large subunit